MREKVMVEKKINSHTYREAVIENDIAKIPLGINAKDGYALVDADNAYIDKYKWSITKNGYPVAGVNRKTISMHVLIMGTKEGKEIDHINRNKVDNRVVNLRFVSRSENVVNTPNRKSNTSGHKNISWNKRKNGWAVNIWRNHKRYSKGYFKDINDALSVKEQMLRELSWKN